MDAFHASDDQFVEFILTLAPLEGENLDHWTWEERRDFLNWCIDQAVLVVEEGRLVPNPVWDFNSEEQNELDSEIGDDTRTFALATGGVEDGYEGD